MCYIVLCRVEGCVNVVRSHIATLLLLLGGMCPVSRPIIDNLAAWSLGPCVTAVDHRRTLDIPGCRGGPPHRRLCNIRSPLKIAWTMERLIFGNHKRQWSWIVYEIRQNNHVHVVCQGRSAPGCRMAEYDRGLTTENADTERSAQQRRI